MRILLALLFSLTLLSCTSTKPQGPIKALLLTGGCCHNYDEQKALISESLKTKMDIDWTIIQEGGKGGSHRFSIYEKENWGKDFDVIVHNECFAKITDDSFMSKVVEDHVKAGKGCVFIHCAMHTFRDGKEGTDKWRELIGVSTSKHDHQSNYTVKNVAKDHPIMKDFPDTWITPKDELYIIFDQYANTVPLATSKSHKTGKEHTCIWTNNYKGCRVFGITFGHNTESMATKEFLDVLAKGVQWSAGRL